MRPSEAHFGRPGKKGSSLGRQIAPNSVHENVTHLAFERPVVANCPKLQVAYHVVREQSDVDGCPASAIVSISPQERYRNATCNP